MHARQVSFQVKSTKQEELTQMFDRDILPLLQKQNGFHDEIAFFDPDRRQVLSITLWDSKESADAYSRETYPRVLKSLNGLIEGSPQVRKYEVLFSTLRQTSPTI